MQVIQHANAVEFQSRVLPTLLQDEAINNRPIGILERGIAEGTTDNWFMACAADRTGRIRLVALIAPPREF